MLGVTLILVLQKLLLLLRIFFLAPDATNGSIDEVSESKVLLERANLKGYQSVAAALYEEGAMTLIYVVLVNLKSMLERSSNTYDYLVDEGAECNSMSDLLLERGREQGLVDLMIPCLLLLNTLLHKFQLQASTDAISFCPMPDVNLDYRKIFESSVEMFQKLYPREEFMPETNACENMEDEENE